MTFTRGQLADLEKVAAWLESKGITATEDLIVRLVKEAVKRTHWHLEERRTTLDDYPSYFAAVLTRGGSTSSPRDGASKKEKAAAEIRASTEDRKRWNDICLELADRGDGRVIAACRRLEQEGKEITVQAVASICPSLLPPPEEGDPDKRFKLRREERSDKHKSTLKPLGDVIQEEAA